ncbi:glycerophosphodiester phosphodiesterase [Nocardiopsis ansamitocini]|uniref:Hydrolase n=1 Tax=Nocardiopsis ansamitocini TaxID=1670832 RepID=A0A9W6UIK5_9ACTN|nr:glycerophosphodiester phosphodiesterase family protein [Nocardiopsis ansamitocini]GLU47792.1 hydrolase [Nocardiopsis ansamitocini]
MFTRLCVAAAVFAITLAGTAPAEAAALRLGGEVVAVAHRGASAYAPENTIAAIDEARARGARTVELDVQQTKDGALVLVHDTTLVRTTDVKKVFPGRSSYRVSDFTLAQIRRLDAGAWFDPAYAGERVPTLKQGLERLRRHRLSLLLELKSPASYPGMTEQVAKLLRSEQWWTGPGATARGRLVVQSFDHEATYLSHTLLPGVAHGVLGKVPREQIADYATWVDQINPNHTSIDAAYVRAVHDEGVEVFVYTVNEPAQMRSAIAKGVDGIISDRPDVLLKVIGESG